MKPMMLVTISDVVIDDGETTKVVTTIDLPALIIVRLIRKNHQSLLQFRLHKKA